MPSRAMSQWSKALPSCSPENSVALMLPLLAFFNDSAQAVSAGFNACWAGTRLDSLSSTGLSWARAAIGAASTALPAAARARVLS